MSLVLNAEFLRQPSLTAPSILRRALILTTAYSVFKRDSQDTTAGANQDLVRNWTKSEFSNKTASSQRKLRRTVWGSIILRIRY